MPKKTRKEQYKYWRQINTIAISKAAGNNGINGVLLDVKALLEAIASQGEEVRVKRATIHVNAVCTAAWHNFFMTIAAMVSDQAIAAATPTVSNSVLDDELDVLTAGDYEERDFGTFRSKSDVGNILSATVDVTSFLQRCSGLLARSAILSVNPYMAIVFAGGVDANNISIDDCTAVFEMQYVNTQKPLRMLA